MVKGMSAEFMALAQEYLANERPLEPAGRPSEKKKEKSNPPWRQPSEVELLGQFASHQYSQWEDGQAWAEQMAERHDEEASNLQQVLASLQAKPKAFSGLRPAPKASTGGGSSSSRAPLGEEDVEMNTREAELDGIEEAEFNEEEAEPIDDPAEAEFDEDDYDAERIAAAEHGISWRQRGPPAPTESTEYWRGQRWRPTTLRWSRRGGSKRAWWDLFYAALRQGGTREEAKKHADEQNANA